MTSQRLARIARRRSRDYRRLAAPFSPPAHAGNSRLGREYTRLFVAPRPLVYPYESMHWDPCPRVMGDSTLDVIRRYREAGFMVSDAWGDLPDHVAVELAFMGTLAGVEAEHRGRGEDEAAQSFAQLQRKFLEDHLLPWIPAFCEVVRGASRLGSFRRAADRLRHLLPRDHDWLLALAGRER